MAQTFTDLLRNIQAATDITGKAISGFGKGLGLDIPTFETTAHSMSWLLRQAKEVRRATLEQTANSSISAISSRDLLKEIVGTIKDKKKDKEEKVIPATASVNTTLLAGDMLMYIYDPKTKNKLPYYDAFPLVFPIELKADGFLGLNMHYLPPTSRASLMDSLYSLLNNTSMDETTRLHVSYEILKGASKFREFKPCIKRYLADHIRSVRLTVHPSQWDMVLMLPTARFVKADTLRVWNDSLDKIRGIKRKANG